MAHHILMRQLKQFRWLQEQCHTRLGLFLHCCSIKCKIGIPFQIYTIHYLPTLLQHKLTIYTILIYLSCIKKWIGSFLIPAAYFYSIYLLNRLTSLYSSLYWVMMKCFKLDVNYNLLFLCNTNRTMHRLTYLAIK